MNEELWMVIVSWIVSLLPPAVIIGILVVGYKIITKDIG